MLDAAAGIAADPELLIVALPADAVAADAAVQGLGTWSWGNQVRLSGSSSQFQQVGRSSVGKATGAGQRGLQSELEQGRYLGTAGGTPYFDGCTSPPPFREGGGFSSSQL